MQLIEEQQVEAKLTKQLGNLHFHYTHEQHFEDPVHAVAFRMHLYASNHIYIADRVVPRLYTKRPPLSALTIYSLRV